VSQQSLWSVFAKGLAMGAADVVPGVSGGTIAFISGIYERLLTSLSHCNPGALLIWYRQGLKSFWQHIDGAFLVSLLAGIFTSIIVLANLIAHWLETSPFLVWSFFSGLILMSVPMLAGQVNQWSGLRVVQFLIGVIIAIIIAFWRPEAIHISLITVFLSGMMASSAMILPGISGSFILLLIGMYSPVLQAVRALDILFLVSFLGGAICGLMLFSKLLHWLYDRYQQIALACLSGFLLGSLLLVWPWQTVPAVEGVSMKAAMVNAVRVSPYEYEQITGHDPMVTACILLAIVGAMSVYLLERKWRK
jgi:putative membrane protein